MSKVETPNIGKQGFKRATAYGPSKTEPNAVWGLTSPADYVSKYGRLNVVSDSSSLGELFSNGRDKHREPLVSRKPVLILPGMQSFDDPVIRFIQDTYEQCDRELPVSRDEDLFTRTGIHREFSSTMSVAGYMQNPMSAKPVDNTLLRESLGLTADYNQRQTEIATMLWRIVFSQARPAKVNVPQNSQGGMRRFTTDAQWKLDYARWKTEPANYDRYLKMVESSDVYGLANDFEIVFGMYVQKRLQLDSINKDRWSNDWAYALSGGRKGERKLTDKAIVFEDGRTYKKFSALRVRVIDAGPWAINCDLQIVASSHMSSLFVRYPKTFHVNTADEVKRNVDGRYVMCTDVSEFDQSMPRGAIAVIFSVMREFYPEGVVRAAERLYAAPYYARPLELGGTEGRWIHDPRDWSFSMNAGNRSGHAFTSLVAKVNKVAETLFLFDHMYRLNERVIHAILKHDMPIGIINNGDDEIIWSATRSDFEKFKALRADPRKGIYVVTPEVGQVFSGMLLVRPNPNKLEYFPTPRVHTSLEKCYIPERSIGTHLRKFWPVGWLDRFDALHRTEVGRVVRDVHNFHYRKTLEPKYGSLNGLLHRGLEEVSLDIRSYANYTEAEREVLADPTKLHYRWSADEISDAVLAKITSNMPPSYSEGWLRRYYKGTLI